MRRLSYFIDLIIVDEGSISTLCVVRLSVKPDEKRRKTARSLKRHWDKITARVKPVQYLFIFYCDKSMLLSILPYNNNKVFLSTLQCLVS